MQRLLKLSLGCLLVLLLSLESLHAADKVSAPSSDEQKVALQTIREIFSADYKSEKREDVARLAGDLLKQAKDENNDFTTRYALFAEAIMLSGKSGASDTAFEAVQEMDVVFQIDRSKIEQYVLGKLFESALTSDEKIAVYNRSLIMIDELESQREFETADALLKRLATFVRRTGDKTKMLAVANRGKALDTFAKQFQKIAEHQKTLETNPEDPEANLTIGKFECFELGNWEKGLPMLIKGSDRELSKLAAQSVAGPEVAAAQYALANGWWDVGESMKGDAGNQVLAYAATWYKLASPELSGLDRVLANKRIEAAPDVESAGGTGRRVIDLLKLVDISKDGRPASKWAMEEDGLHCTQMHLVPKLLFPYKPPLEYDVKFVFQQPKIRNGVGVLIPNPKESASLNWTAGNAYGSRWWMSAPDADSDQTSGRFEEKIAVDTPYKVEVNVRRDRIIAKFNGEEVMNYPTDYAGLKVNSWHNTGGDWELLGIHCDDPTLFSSVQVIEITGQGEITRQPQ